MHEEIDSKKNQDINQKGMKKKTKRNIMIATTILIVLLFLVLIRSCSITPSERVEPIARPGVGEVVDGDLPNMTDEQIRGHLKKKQDASLFTVAANSEATFEKGNKILNLLVANPENNSVDCYFEILEKNEVIYTSPIMKPRQYIQTAELSKELLEGTNKLIVRYSVVHQEKVIGVVEVEIQAVSKAKGV